MKSYNLLTTQPKQEKKVRFAPLQSQKSLLLATSFSQENRTNSSASDVKEQRNERVN